MMLVALGGIEARLLDHLIEAGGIHGDVASYLGHRGGGIYLPGGVIEDLLNHLIQL